MNSSLIQLLVLAGIAIFLILKLRDVLGTRDGFEKPPVPLEDVRPRVKRDFEVIDGGPDRDITDHAPEGSPSALALAAMKKAEPGFVVNTFLQGARGAYEMILMGFERGDITAVRPFLSAEIADSFDAAIAGRNTDGGVVNANFIGLREIALVDAEYDPITRNAEITVRFLGELTSVTKDAAGAVIAGSADEIKRQRDVWSFGRVLGSKDPNWQLVATGD